MKNPFLQLAVYVTSKKKLLELRQEALDAIKLEQSSADPDQEYINQQQECIDIIDAELRKR
jgi:hypothetical protein